MLTALHFTSLILCYSVNLEKSAPDPPLPELVGQRREVAHPSPLPVVTMELIVMSESLNDERSGPNFSFAQGLLSGMPELAAALPQLVGLDTPSPEAAPSSPRRPTSFGNPMYCYHTRLAFVMLMFVTICFTLRSFHTTTLSADKPVAIVEPLKAKTPFVIVKSAASNDQKPSAPVR
jgi:hypothetical protein